MSAITDYIKAHFGSTPQPTSYVGQQNGGVSGNTAGPLGLLAGQNTSQVTPALQSTLPDAGDVAAVNSANAQYKILQDQWQTQQQELGSKIIDAANHGDLPSQLRYLSQLRDLQAKPPQPPDVTAIQNQSDRNRLLNEATDAYTPLINSLGSAAQGQGPSQALDQYRIAADEAQRRLLGVAASSNGTGGQRAATQQSALAQVAQAQQQSAGQAAAIGATEQQNARSALNSSLAGLTNVYGTQLYGGTQNQQTSNQNAQNNAIALNAQTANQNAANASALSRSVVSAGAQAVGAA